MSEIGNETSAMSANGIEALLSSAEEFELLCLNGCGV